MYTLAYSTNISMHAHERNITDPEKNQQEESWEIGFFSNGKDVQY